MHSNAPVPTNAQPPAHITVDLPLEAVEGDDMGLLALGVLTWIRTRPDGVTVTVDDVYHRDGDDPYPLRAAIRALEACGLIQIDAAGGIR